LRINLVHEHKVGVIPGPAFRDDERRYFRVAYGALQKEKFAEGMGRLVNGLRAIRKLCHDVAGG